MNVLRLPPGGPRIASERDLGDLVGDVLGEGADVVAIPIARLDPRFFDLRSGLAGALFQKAMNYRFGLAIVGDVTPHAQTSRAFHDLVVEHADHPSIWFVADDAALAQRLGSER